MTSSEHETITKRLIESAPHKDLLTQEDISFIRGLELVSVGFLKEVSTELIDEGISATSAINAVDALLAQQQNQLIPILKKIYGDSNQVFMSVLFQIYRDKLDGTIPTELTQENAESVTNSLAQAWIGPEANTNGMSQLLLILINIFLQHTRYRVF